MTTLYVACGIPGSGKSTTFRSIKEIVDVTGKNTFEIVSRDAIRFAKLRENQNIQYFDKEKEVWKEYIDTIQKYLDEKLILLLRMLLSLIRNQEINYLIV